MPKRTLRRIIDERLTETIACALRVGDQYPDGDPRRQHHAVRLAREQTGLLVDE